MPRWHHNIAVLAVGVAKVPRANSGGANGSRAEPRRPLDIRLGGQMRSWIHIIAMCQQQPAGNMTTMSLPQAAAGWMPSYQENHAGDGRSRDTQQTSGCVAAAGSERKFDTADQGAGRILCSEARPLRQTSFRAFSRCCPAGELGPVSII